MSIRRDLLMRTALLRLPDLVALRALATAGGPAAVAAAAAKARPAPRRGSRRALAATSKA